MLSYRHFAPSDGGFRSRLPRGLRIGAGVVGLHVRRSADHRDFASEGRAGHQHYGNDVLRDVDQHLQEYRGHEAVGCRFGSWVHRGVAVHEGESIFLGLQGVSVKV